MGNDDVITMQIELPPDAAGFIGFECPRCRRYFKVVAATVTNSANVHCTYCGHSDESEKFLTEAEVDYVKQIGAGRAAERLHRQFQDHLLNAFRNNENVRVTREQASPPNLPPRPGERELPHQNTCSQCSLVYAFESDAKVCPQCQAPAA